MKSRTIDERTLNLTVSGVNVASTRLGELWGQDTHLLVFLRHLG